MNTQITVKDIINVTKGKLVYGDENQVCENFARNTKEISQGDIYVGFKGEKYDGGKFYEEAINAGAAGCIINKIEGLEINRIPNKFVIQVEDTIKAIGQIAKLKREKYAFLTLDKVKEGGYRKLTFKEVTTLYSLCNSNKDN